MSKILPSVLEAVGNTPLIRLNHVTAGVAATVCAKVEACNPGRSVKDRIALAVVEDAERRGLLKPGGTLVEPTSGNMGVALAIVAAVKGYKCIFTIPDKMSIEKIRRLRAFGAEVVVTPTAVPPESPQSYYSVARRLAEEIPGAFLLVQYDNPSNLLFECIDSVVTVSDRESFLMGRRLTREEGLFCGGSSGTAVEGALRYARERQLGENDLVVVLLPDAGEIYLSKMYSDEWMRQNQFLGRSLPVGEILKSKTRPLPELLSVELTSTVRDAIETMNQSGVSQLPVFDKGNLVGSLSETALFQKTMETPEVRELTVGALLEPPFPTVGPDEDVYEVVKLLKSFPAVLVRDGGKYHGIVTRFDVVEHLGE